jgi:sphingomyelin phosphodiesterase
VNLVVSRFQPEINDSRCVTAIWELYYSARDTYDPLVPNLTESEPLSPTFWHILTEIFASSDTAFQVYNTFLSRGGVVAACTDACKTAAIVVCGR